MNDCQILGFGVSAYFMVSCKGLALKWLIFNLVKFLGSFKYAKIVPFALQFFIHIWKHLSRRKVLSAIVGTFYMSYRKYFQLWKLQLSLYLGLPPSHRRPFSQEKGHSAHKVLPFVEDASAMCPSKTEMQSDRRKTFYCEHARNIDSHDKTLKVLRSKTGSKILPCFTLWGRSAPICLL